MSAFDEDHAENMKNPEFAYEYGRTERELEIVKLLDGLMDFETNTKARLEHKLALQVLKNALIKGEK